MKKTFCTPVAMRCETQEQADNAVSILKELGYKFDTMFQWTGRYGVCYIVTGVDDDLSETIFSETIFVHEGHSILRRNTKTPYNPALFRALASMQSEGWNKGEWIESTIVKGCKGVVSSELEDSIAVNWIGSTYSEAFPHSIVSPAAIRKLTAQEIIDHFSKAEAEPAQPKEQDEPEALTYGGDIADFPVEIVKAMLDEQERQGNKRDVTVFEKDNIADQDFGGFIWCNSIEGGAFWESVISDKDFAHFFARYPKTESDGSVTISAEAFREIWRYGSSSLRKWLNGTFDLWADDFTLSKEQIDSLYRRKHSEKYVSILDKHFKREEVFTSDMLKDGEAMEVTEPFFSGGMCVRIDGILFYKADEEGDWVQSTSTWQGKKLPPGTTITFKSL